MIPKAPLSTTAGVVCLLYLTMLSGATGRAQSTGATLPLPSAKCDGSTDDTASIQTLIDAALKGNNRVDLPVGTCIIAPATADLILRVGSGLTIEGQGTTKSVIKVKDDAGSYTTIFGPLWAKVDGVTFKNLVIDYNSSRSQPKVLDRPRFLISTSRGSKGLTFDNVVVRDIESINSIYSGSDDTEIRNCRFEMSPSATLPHDHSTIYIAAEHGVLEGNTFVGALNVAGSVTAIETHGGAQVVQHNVISGYFVGMNITGIAPTESKDIRIADNEISDTYHGIAIWSKKYRTHTSGPGISGMLVAHNTIAVAQTRWVSDPVTGKHVLGNASGITVDPTSDLPLASLEISDNSVEYQSDVGPQNVLASSAMGIGYWDAAGLNSASDVKIARNKIINAPSTAIRWAAGTQSLEITGNQIIEAACSSSDSLAKSYRTAVMISPNAPATSVSLSNNNISASKCNLAYAIEVLGQSCVVADANTVTIAGDSLGKYSQYAYTTRGGCTQITRGAQISPPLQRSMLPESGVVEGSSVSDSAGNSWRYNGAGWIQVPK